MEACKATMLLTLLVATATIAEAMNYLALPRMGRSGYLAFPRMGRRSYLAFPRMGRRFPADGSDVSKDGGDCCLTGLKMEWVPQEGGTTTTQNVCGSDSCCPGLRELLGQKPDGVFYSMCIPATPSSEDGVSEKSEGANKNVLQKLHELLQN